MAINSPSTQFFGWKDETYGVKFKVNFPKAPEMELILIGAEFHQTAAEHERLVLHFKGKPFVRGTELNYKDPVIFIFESGKVKRTFQGKIHKVYPEGTTKVGNTDVVCVGTSSNLKNKHSRTFTNTTADAVVKKVAAANKMTPKTQRHPRKKKSIVQTSDNTDWEFLRRLAKQTGFCLIAENSTLTFMSKDKVYESTKKTAPYFNYVDDPNGGVATKWDRNTGTLLGFKANLADSSPETGVGVNSVVTGVDEKTGKILKSKHLKKKEPTNKGAATPGKDFFL